jgi:hypothetical protein
MLDDQPEGVWAVLERAVELAEGEHARLTLAKTCGPGRVASCMCSFGALACTPPVSYGDLQAEAAGRLARAAEMVPASISLTTVVLGRDTAGSLRSLVGAGCHDLLVVRAGFLARRRGLRRAITKLEIATLTVAPAPVAPSRLPARQPLRPWSAAWLRASRGDDVIEKGVRHGRLT